MSHPYERRQIVAVARSIFQRGLTHGSTGNISVRVPEGFLVTPTGSSLGTVEAEDLALVDLHGRSLSAQAPSKEAFLHAALFRARPAARAVIHTHSTYAAAVSCLADIDDGDVLPPLTAYFAMRVGRLRALPYFAPGDEGLGATAEQAARSGPALLLRNHGPILAGADLAATLDALEELEETAKLFLLLRGSATAPLPETERARLTAAW